MLKDKAWKWIDEHSGEFIAVADKVWGYAALDLITDPELRRKAKAEHSERLKGRAYKTPLPEGLQPPLDVARENREKSPKQ